ncbi:MAG: aldehyde ferredoxin oxidoreductase N-terminal domain-containing protein [Promethearchaeota archaeon]
MISGIVNDKGRIASRSGFGAIMGSKKLKMIVLLGKNKMLGRVFGVPPDLKGPTKGITIDYEDFYKGYCYEMGWNPDNGYPLKDTLKELNLEFVIKDLY